MNKDQLKEYLRNLKLDTELESMLLELIDKAKEVNATLINSVADVLEARADLLDKSADILDQEAEMYDNVADELTTLDKEEDVEKLKAIKDEQEKLLTDIQQKLIELKPTSQTSTLPTT